MWRASSPGPEEIRLLRRARSIASFRGEFQRAAAIGAEYLVLHPGSYKGQMEEGIAAFVLVLRDGAAGAAGMMKPGVTVLLENTVGCGALIGGRFEELRAIRDYPSAGCRHVAHVLNVPCPHSCGHLASPGVRTRHAECVRHDRHANIGEGYIGKAGFRRILAMTAVIWKT